MRSRQSCARNGRTSRTRRARVAKAAGVTVVTTRPPTPSKPQMAAIYAKAHAIGADELIQRHCQVE